MKILAAIVSAISLLAVTSTAAFADQYVHGYTRKDGTYVSPYYRSSPDSTKTNNFSYYGNVNPYTGAVGTNHNNSPNTYGSTYNSQTYSPYQSSYGSQSDDPNQ